jgi:hypothetical protein
MERMKKKMYNPMALSFLGGAVVAAASDQKRKEEARASTRLRVHAQARSRKCWQLHPAGLHYWCRQLNLPCEDSHFATSLVCLYRATGDDKTLTHRPMR